MSTKREHQRIEWRREKVRELSVKGHTQRDIASTLHIALVIVNKDLQYLRQQAKKNISRYINEYLPSEYENCLDGLNNILTKAWQMSLDGEKRERMQALSLAKDCYAMKLDFLSSATVIDRAVKFVERNRGFIHQSEELVINDITRTE